MLILYQFKEVPECSLLCLSNNKRASITETNQDRIMRGGPRGRAVKSAVS